MEKKNQDSDFDVNFCICYNKFYTRIYNYIKKKFIKDVFVIEDITHNIFLKIYEKKIFLDPEAPGLVKFFYVTARNMVFDYINRHNNEQNKLKQVYVDEVNMDKDFYRDVEDFYIEGEVLLTIHDTINSFPEKEKDIYIKKKIENLNDVDIIDKTNVSRYKIKKIERKINDKITERLGDGDEVEYDESLEFNLRYCGLLCEPKSGYD